MTPKKERLSSTQISFMIMMFEIGSTPLFLLGSKAKQDSWLAMIIGSAAGCLLLLCYIWMQRLSLQDDLIGLFKQGFGRFIGSSVGFIYCLYFAYQSMRNVRDFGELTKLTLLPKSPMFVTMLIFLILGGYAIWKGAEVLFKLPEILLPVVLFFYFVIVILLLIMRNIDFRRLAPVLENGILPVIKAALPDLVSFPFGQMIVFLMFWSLWEKPGIPVKQTLLSYSGISLFLVCMNAINLAILGPIIGGVSQFPFLKSVRTLSNLRFIERLDLLVVILLFLGLLMKMTLFFYCAVRGMSHVFSKSSRADKWIVFPIGLLIYGSSFIEKDYEQHFAVGLGPSLKVDIVFQIAIPLLLLLFLLIRKRFKASSAKRKQNDS